MYMICVRIVVIYIKFRVRINKSYAMIFCVSFRLEYVITKKRYNCLYSFFFKSRENDFRINDKKYENKSNFSITNHTYVDLL